MANVTRPRRATGLAGLVAALLLCLLALPAAAQPYPPSPPPEPPASELEVTCEVDDAPDLACRGEGYLPGSTVTIEVRRSGSDTVVASFEVQVDEDGTFTAHRPLPCAVGGGEIVVTVSGRDSQDQPTVESRTLQVPPAPDCDPTDPDRAGVAGDQDVRGAPDGDDDGSLAFTGRDLLVLLAIALVVLALGAALVRARRQQGDGPA